MRVLLGMATVLFMSPLTGQALPAASVPPAVQRALMAKYPGIATPTWTLAADKNYVAGFHASGAGVAARFTPTGQWVESATEIGAITLPDTVRRVIIRAYKGYQFTRTRRLDRATSPARLYEVRLEKPGDVVIAQFESNGAVFGGNRTTAPPLSVMGTWLGVSICLPGYPACNDETVVYHILPVGADTTGFDTQMNKLVDGHEEEMATLPCTFDQRGALFYCVTPQGTWRFQVTRDSIVGGLTLRDSTQARRVAVRRKP